MQEQPLVDMLADTFQRVEARAEAHSHALAYAAAQQIVGYLHRRVGRLRREVTALRGAGALLVTACGDSQSDDPRRDNLWRRTARDLLREEPRQFQAPAAAIAAGHNELYDLVAYLGAAIALVRERRRQATAEIVEILGQLAPGLSARGLRAAQLPELSPIDQQRIADLLALADDEADGSGVALRAALTSLGMQTQTPGRDDSSCEVREG